MFCPAGDVNLQIEQTNDTIKSGKFTDSAYNRSGIPANYFRSFCSEINRNITAAPRHNNNNRLSHSEGFIYFIFHPVVVECVHTADNKDNLCSLNFGSDGLCDFVIGCVRTGQRQRLFFWCRVVVIRKPRRSIQEIYKSVIFIAVSPCVADKNAIIVQSRHLKHPFLFWRLI
nr:MAG TPA: hypothetical protein [Caudoviricetes sp.]